PDNQVNDMENRDHVAAKGAPERYIARISRRSGQEIPGPIDPRELLIDAHRNERSARDYDFRFRKPALAEQTLRQRLATLQRDAGAALQRRGSRSRLCVLLTGATGCVGKEIIHQIADDDRVEEVVALLRPETLRDPRTKEITRTLDAPERGAV